MGAFAAVTTCLTAAGFAGGVAFFDATFLACTCSPAISG